MIDNRLELFHGEGLGHEVVHAGPQRMLFGAHVAVGRHPYDGQAPPNILNFRLVAARANHGAAAVVHPGIGQGRAGGGGEEQVLGVLSGGEREVALTVREGVSTVA